MVHLCPSISNHKGRLSLKFDYYCQIDVDEALQPVHTEAMQSCPVRPLPLLALSLVSGLLGMGIAWWMHPANQAEHSWPQSINELVPQIEPLPLPRAKVGPEVNSSASSSALASNSRFQPAKNSTVVQRGSTTTLVKPMLTRVPSERSRSNV